jgi:hypothetical protein
LLGQAERNLTTSVRLFGTPITLPQCQGAHCLSRFPRGVAVGGASALNGAVMQCSERVVALPDPKKCGKYLPNQHLLGSSPASQRLQV